MKMINVEFAIVIQTLLKIHYYHVVNVQVV